MVRTKSGWSAKISFTVAGATLRKQICLGTSDKDVARVKLQRLLDSGGPPATEARVQDTCETCGCSFSVTRPGGTPKRFCSKQCKNKNSIRDRLIKEERALKRTTLPCMLCGLRFRQKKKDSHFCCPGCCRFFFSIRNNSMGGISAHDVASAMKVDVCAVVAHWYHVDQLTTGALSLESRYTDADETI